MPGHDIIVIGASAGGVEALIRIVQDLPRNFPASIFIVLHLPPQSPSRMPEILNRASALHVLHPVDYQRIEPEHIYIALPDYHLIVKDGFMRVVRGPKENRHRPAIDPLFRSAAVAYGSRVVGVVLTGSLNDGTAGLLAIKKRGGITVVQDPDDALYPDMPRSALAHVSIDYCLPITDISSLLARLMHEKVTVSENSLPVPIEMEREVRIAGMETNPLNDHEQVGEPSAYSCPECGGVLWEVHDGELIRFRCRTGHAFSTEDVLAEQNSKMEQALWVALKTLDEQVSLSRRLAAQAKRKGHHWLAQHFAEKEQEATKHAALLRQVLTADSAVLLDVKADH